MGGIQLSEQAYIALADSGAQELLDTNREVFVGLVLEQGPTTVGDIYQFSQDIIVELFDDRPDIVEHITAYAEKQGPFFIGQLKLLMSSYLRDEALKEVEIG